MRKLLATTALTGVLLTAPSLASADPVDDARHRVDILQHEAEASGQDYVAARERHREAEKKLAIVGQDLAAQDKRVAERKRTAGLLALAQTQEDSFSATLRIVTSSTPDDLIHRLGLVEQVEDSNNEKVLAFQQESFRLEGLKREADLYARESITEEKKAREAKTRANEKVDEAKQVLDRLTAEQRARIAAQERAEAREASQAAPRVTTPRSSVRRSESSPAPQKATPAPRKSSSGRGATALAYAQAQIGKPYVFGAAGPDAFDCSGLTSAAWRTAGVSLPRTSQAQFSVGTAIPRSQLRPGDLVFFYSGISHVGLYAGNGMVLHASKPGSPVGYLKMSYMPYMGARRPG